MYENYLTSLVFPGERWDDMFFTDVVIPVMEYDTNVNIRPMSYYVESPRNIDRLFDNVAYSKCKFIIFPSINLHYGRARNNLWFK